MVKKRMVDCGDRIAVGGYFPGGIRSINRLHACPYHDHRGVDRSFEIQAGSKRCEFARTVDPLRDGSLVVTKDTEFIGAIALDGSMAPAEGARMRWFTVDPCFHGRGIGQNPLNGAITKPFQEPTKCS